MEEKEEKEEKEEEEEEEAGESRYTDLIKEARRNANVSLSISSCSLPASPPRLRPPHPGSPVVSPPRLLLSFHPFPPLFPPFLFPVSFL